MERIIKMIRCLSNAARIIFYNRIRISFAKENNICGCKRYPPNVQYKVHSWKSKKHGCMFARWSEGVVARRLEIMRVVKLDLLFKVPVKLDLPKFTYRTIFTMEQLSSINMFAFSSPTKRKNLTMVVFVSYDC